MEKIFDNLLLLALPASGKSEIRKFLLSMDPVTRMREFHIGEMFELDDFPYVHMMRRIDDELKALGEKTIFFHSPDKPFLEPVSWGVLIKLLNEDYENLIGRKKISPENSAVHLMERIDSARRQLDVPPLFFKDGKPILPADKFQMLTARLKDECDNLIRNQEKYPDAMEGITIIIEFARGGPDGASMPIPYGYQYSISLLSPEILEKSALLYIWVTPEESRRKNFERSDPNDPGSILKHGVPLEVMMKDYGCDDMDYLLENSDSKGFIKIEQAGRTFYIPTEKYDNRQDKTSFIRNDEWKEEEKELLFNTLRKSASNLFEKYSAVKI